MRRWAMILILWGLLFASTVMTEARRPTPIGVQLMHLHPQPQAICPCAV